MKNIIIVNKKDFDRKKAEFREDGANSIHILTDFDRTLTKAFFNGKKVVSFISDGSIMNVGSRVEINSGAPAARPSRVKVK